MIERNPILVGPGLGVWAFFPLNPQHVTQTQQLTLLVAYPTSLAICCYDLRWSPARKIQKSTLAHFGSATRRFETSKQSIQIRVPPCRRTYSIVSRAS